MSGESSMTGGLGSANSPIDVTAKLLIDDSLERFGGGRERLIPILHRLQDHLGFIPPEAEEYVARSLGLTTIEVRGVLSFYPYFSVVPRGRYHFKMCLGTACYVSGGRRLLDAIQEEIGIEVGETSVDRLFSLRVARCIGACGLACAVSVNDQVFGRLSPAAVRSMIRRLRVSAENANGLAPEGHHG